MNVVQSKLSHRRLRIWLRMLRLTRQTENQLREFLRVNFETTLPRFDVAAALYRVREPIKMSDLSQLLLVSNGNATTIVRHMEEEGLVRRVPDSGDRRVTYVSLTDKGRITFETWAAAHEAEIDKLFAPLTHDDLDVMRDVFHRMKEEPDDMLD